MGKAAIPTQLPIAAPTSVPPPEHNAASPDPCDTVPMVPGAELRARLAALPFLVLAIPGQCSLVAPAWDIAAVDPSAIAPKVQEPVEPWWACQRWV